MNKIFLLGELFCGPGGMALGAKIAKPQKSSSGDIFSISHVWGVDKDKYAIQTYNRNSMGDGVECDAIEFSNPSSICNHKTIKDFEKITALAFGFPCNDFSLVGKRKGSDGVFGNLYKAGIYAINYANPIWFVAENVSGIHSANQGTTFKNILAELDKAGKYGYELTVNLYKFEDYGVPQYRHRYIIVGIRKDYKLKFKVPSPTHKNKHISTKAKLSEPYNSQHIFNNEHPIQTSKVAERLLFTPPWHNAWFLEKMLEMTPVLRREILTQCSWYSQKLKKISDNEILDRIKACKLHCKRAKMSHIYRRLHPDKPSYTITGSGGGGTHVYHWEECRALSNRERARLQSFPDDFIFIGTKEQVRKQIGMAVPPVGAKIIFESILKTFAGIPYEFVENSYTF